MEYGELNCPRCLGGGVCTYPSRGLTDVPCEHCRGTGIVHAPVTILSGPKFITYPRVSLVIEPESKNWLLIAWAKAVTVSVGTLAITILLAMLWQNVMPPDVAWRYVPNVVGGVLLGGIAYNIGYLWITK